jgi:hypothetical protein
MPELNESIQESAPAPGTDSAATQPADVAVESTSAATPAATEAAAPSTEGAVDAPRSLDSIRDKYRSRANEEQKPDASPTTEEAKPEKPEKPAENPDEKEDAEDADAEEADATEADPLAEFEEPKPLTREEIDAQHPRVPKAVREQWAASEEERGRLLTEREELGGEQGVTVAKAIAPALWNAEPGEKEADILLDAVSEANTPLALACGQRLIKTALEDEATGKEFASSLFVGEFGEGYDLDRISKLVEADKAGSIPENLFTKAYGEGYDKSRVDKLVELDKAGLIDMDDAEEDLADFKSKQPTVREAELQARVKELEGKQSQSPDEKQRASQAEQQRRKDDEAVDSYVTDRAVSAVLPIAIKQGLAAGDEEEGAEDRVLFGKILTAYLDSEVKAFPEYHHIRALKQSGNAYRGGKPTSQLVQKTDSLEKRAKALFLSTVRTLRGSQTIPVPTRRSPTGPKPQTDGDGGEQPKPIPTQVPQSTDGKPKSLEDIKAKYRNRIADEQRQVGVAGRR